MAISEGQSNDTGLTEEQKARILGKHTVTVSEAMAVLELRSRTRIYQLCDEGKLTSVKGKRGKIDGKSLAEEYKNRTRQYEL